MLKTTALLAVSCVALSGCEVSRVEPLSIPLAYTQQPRNSGQLGALSCSTITQLEVQDARTNKVLGVRVHESKPLTADVSASTDAGTWVHDGMQSYLSQNGLGLAGSGPKLVVSLDSLSTRESIWHRSSYTAGIALTARLQSAAGKSCWKATVQGRGGNYGYSGSVLNYQETLNEALDDATLSMTNAGLKAALCHCGD
jgi:Uncharacterized lipoprotein